MSPTTFLVSGTERGLGLGFVRQLAQRDNVLIFAGVIDPEHPDADEVKKVAEETGKVCVVKLVSASEEDAQAVAALVKEKAGKLDYVIANAGIMTARVQTLETPPEQLHKHFAVNTVGPYVLFQTFAPLLFASPSPHFLAISSTLGSMVLAGPSHPTVAYSMSKAALNMFVVKIAHEYGAKHNLAAYVLSPGWVATAQGNTSAMTFGGHPEHSIEEAVGKLLKVVDGATRESAGGKFLQYTGEELPW
ncbi:hypothetical protein Rhopal_004849-T1 [Rhodotorula paludigena]|uniref:NAD(P)-binding protein n=1 Tax=Rhodotorula paludigena TaxID=86838 RepID=A0AAV5GQN4_9BASI|nr:hypothetical protein Rhopal_004849-T1 [Rhodotorula paludigena]